MDALDRDLSAALAVDPSPEFLARVRERIAREPEPRFWRMPRLLLAGAALSAVVAVAVSVGRVDDRVPAVLQTASPAALLAPAAVEPALADVQPAARYPRPRQEISAIQMVSISEMPTEPIGTAVPGMTFDLVTLTGVHP